MNTSDKVRPPKVFISYSHETKRHESLVLALSNQLRAHGIDAILDQYETAPPEGWPLWMDKQIRDADFVLMICTETYLRRVMNEEQPGRGLGIRWEATISYQHLYNAGAINTKFIPVLFSEGDQVHIPKPLQSTTYYLLDNKEGYERLYRRLTNQLSPIPMLGEVQKLPVRENQPEQTAHVLTTTSVNDLTTNDKNELQTKLLSKEKDHYVPRKQDKELLRELKQTGVTITIKGPRKTGKTSLLVNALQKTDKKYIYIDLETIDDHIIDQVDAFYAVICDLIASEFSNKIGAQWLWNHIVSTPQQVTTFIEDHVLKDFKEPFTIAIDHADQLVGTNLSVDFFPMLRQWHNRRFEGVGWESVDLVIVISTDPKLLIKDNQGSPFNVGSIIHLDDFSYDDVVVLNSLYKNPLSADNLHKLYRLLNGHPYLTRLAMDAISNESLDQLQPITSPLRKNSPFIGYLQSLSLKLKANPNLAKALKQIADHEYPKKQNVNILLQAGIIRMIDSQLEFRNNLYRLYFKDVL